MASQRERLLEAMTYAAARHGYSDASVARVIERAGVSRATFYEYFANREDCFRAAYERCAEAVATRIAANDGTCADQAPRRLLTGLLGCAEARPAAARVLTIESRAAGSLLRGERQQLQELAESAVGDWLAAPPVAGARPEVPARALVGGIEAVIAVRVFRGEAARLGGLLFDLLDWIKSYAPSSGRPSAGIKWEAVGRALTAATGSDRSAAESEGRLPRGRSALPPHEVEADQRERLLAAVARLCRERGYAEITVADIVAAAGVTRSAFYRQFRNKQEAFLATQTAALQVSISLAAGAFFGAGTWPERVWDGLAAMLAYVASEPDLAWLDIAECFAAGPPAVGRSFDNRMAFSLFLEEGYGQSSRARRLPRLCSEAIGGAILELLRACVLRGRTERALELLPQAVYVALAPFLGPEEATAFVEEKVSRGAIPT